VCGNVHIDLLKLSRIGMGGPGWLNELPNNSYKPITNTTWVRARLCKLQKGCTRLAVASDKVYQLLAHGRWFSPGTPASSTTKTGRHDIDEVLLKVALKHQKPKKQYHWYGKCNECSLFIQQLICLFEFNKIRLY
jgi:hypothetical protein